MKGGNTKYLVSAICLLALGILIFAVETYVFTKICGLVLIILCLSGQWLRYIKSTRG